MTEWLALGLDDAKFWSLTPRELQVHIKAAGVRREREDRARAWLAWHTAAFHRVEHLRPLDELMGGPRRAAKVQPIEQMRHNAMLFTQLLGGTVIRRDSADA